MLISQLDDGMELTEDLWLIWSVKNKFGGSFVLVEGLVEGQQFIKMFDGSELYEVEHDHLSSLSTIGMWRIKPTVKMMRRSPITKGSTINLLETYSHLPDVKDILSEFLINISNNENSLDIETSGGDSSGRIVRVTRSNPEMNLRKDIDELLLDVVIKEKYDLVSHYLKLEANPLAKKTHFMGMLRDASPLYVSAVDKNNLKLTRLLIETAKFKESPPKIDIFSQIAADSKDTIALYLYTIGFINNSLQKSQGAGFSHSSFNYQIMRRETLSDNSPLTELLEERKLSIELLVNSIIILIFETEKRRPGLFAIFFDQKFKPTNQDFFDDHQLKNEVKNAIEILFMQSGERCSGLNAISNLSFLLTILIKQVAVRSAQQNRRENDGELLEIVKNHEFKINLGKLLSHSLEPILQEIKAQIILNQKSTDSLSSSM